MGWDSDGTSEHEERFEGGRRIVYKESVDSVGGFPFLLSLLVLLYSKASYDFETVSTLVLFCLVFDITFLSPISPTHEPARYNKNNINQHERHRHRLRQKPRTQRKTINPKEKQNDSHSLHTRFLQPSSVSAFHFPWQLGMYEMLLNWLSNWTNLPRIAYTAAEICARASINNSGSLVTTSWNIGLAVVLIFVSWCANIFASASNILL